MRKIMMGQGRHTEDAREPKTAGEYRHVADEHVQTLKDFWKNFLISGLFVVATIVIILACLAWFYNNSQVRATGASVSAAGARYTLTSDGDKHGFYDDQSQGLDVSDSMQVSASSNLKNYDGSGELAPGSYGTLTFTVTPYASDLRDVSISLGRCIETRSGSIIGADDASDVKTLISGHILFFEEKDSNGYYGKPILNDTITIKSSEFGSPTTKAVTKTLYWVWPEQFQNFVLTGRVNYNQNLFAAPSENKDGTLNDHGQSSLLRDVENHKEKYFVDSRGIPSEIVSNMSTADLQACSNAYNEADESVGKTVRYVQVRFTADEANAVNAAGD